MSSREQIGTMMAVQRGSLLRATAAYTYERKAHEVEKEMRSWLKGSRHKGGSGLYSAVAAARGRSRSRRRPRGR